jgi:hypothetical protein
MDISAAVPDPRGDLPVGLIFRNRVNPRPEKYFAFSEEQINHMVSSIPHPPRGALRDRHECWARDAMDAAALPDEARLRGRQRRVVLISRRWDQALRHVPQGDGGYQARTPGRARYKP